MARLTFPSDRLVYAALAYANSPLESAVGLVATVYSDAAGTVLADVQNFDGTANSTATFTVDSTSRLPLWLGPADGTDTLYVKVGTGPVTAVYAVTSGDISAAVGTEVANRSAADAAHVAASDPHGDRVAAAADASSKASAAQAAAIASAATDATSKANSAQAAATAAAATDATTKSNAAQAAAIAASQSVVVHGSTAGTARPSGATVVHWIGSVAPTNIATNDEWTDTANKIVKRWNGSSYDTFGSASYLATQAAPTLDAPGLGLYFPEAHGAVGDGITDDTAAIQAAMDAAHAAGGGTVVLRPVVTYAIKGAQQTGTAFGYTYSGQLLFRATAGLTSEFAVKIRGTIRANSSNDADYQGFSGALLKSNATSGNVFDCVPGFTAFAATYGWTGVQPAFEDVVLVCPNNPQCGGIRATTAFRFDSKNLTITTDGSPTTTLTGSGVALALPQTNNSGDLGVEAQIVGFPVGIDMSEHAVLRKVYIGRCLVAFQGSTGSGHVNKFVAVDVEECVTVLKTVNPGGLVVDGTLDGEGVNTGSFAQGALVDEWNQATVQGQLRIVTNASSWRGGFALGIKYSGVGLDLVNAIGPGGGLGSPGWRGRHPQDDFTRQVALSGAGPGTAWPTLHPWRLAVGTFSVASNQLKGTTGSGGNAALLPTRFGKTGGESRILTATFTLGATSPWVEILAHGVYAGSSQSLQTNILKCQIAAGHMQLVVNGSNRLASLGTFSPNTTYTVSLEILYLLGSPYMIKGYSGTTLLGSYILTAAEIAALQPGSVFPYLEDGIQIFDTGTAVTAFKVVPAQAEPPFVATGSAVLVAGTVTIANTSITANSVVKVWSIKSGGTVGALSVTLTAGTSFTINSTSASDTSTVLYEITSY